MRFGTMAIWSRHLPLIPSRTDFVHATLRAELAQGLRRPGSALSVKDTAARLRVSPTPVREALERLVGEGLVVPTGSKVGFQVIRLSGTGLIQTIELHETLAIHALGHLSHSAPSRPPLPLDDDAAAAIETAFGTIFWERSNAQVAVTAARLSGLLASFRRHEPILFPNWREELIGLTEALAGPRKAAMTALRVYHRRRTARAADLIAFEDEG